MDAADEGTEARAVSPGERSRAARAAAGAGWTLAAGLLLWAAVHVFVPPISAKHVPPESHFGGACWACHLMTAAPPAGGE